MLQNIRKNIQGTFAKVIMAIIVIPFALVGIESLLSGGGVQYVAEVNGQGVSAVELQQQINQQKRRLLLALGDNIDPAMLDDQMLYTPALNGIIQKYLMLQAARGYGLAVADEQLATYISGIEAFHTDGRFDPELFRRIVSDQGYTPAGFQKALREDLVMSQLRAGLAGSEFVTEQELALYGRFSEEQRDLRYMVLPLEQFREDATPDEQQISAWYEAHQNEFLTPESVTLNYIELKVDDFRMPVEESRLRELYEAEKQNFQTSEERRVSHILLVQGDNEAEEALQARINEVEQRVAAGSDDFAALATEFSDDVGSAAFGGDLGYTDGAAFPEEMESAIATLQLNEVSPAVQSDAGWHIIKLTEIRPGENRSFEDVRPELESQLQTAEAGRELVKTVEQLRNLVFNADDLSGPAGEVGLSVLQSDAITRDQREGLFANPRLLAAAFSSEVLNDGFNSDVIEIDPEHFVVLRKNTHSLPAVEPLESVRDRVVASIIQESASEAIREKASSLLAELRSGASIEDVALANQYQWQVELGAKRDNRDVPPTLLRRAFQLPPPTEGERALEYVQNSEGDIELFELVRVIPGDVSKLNAARREALGSRMMNELARRADELYQQELQAHADIERS